MAGKQSELEAFKLTPELRKKLEAEVEKAGISKSEFIRRAIEDRLLGEEFRGKDVIGRIEVDELGQEWKIPFSKDLLGYAIEIENFLRRNPELVKSVFASLSSYWQLGKKTRKRKMRKRVEKKL